MTAYAFFVTFVLGICVTLISIYGYLAHKDGKALKRIEAHEKRRHDAWRRQVLGELEEDDMQQAVDLCAEKLGATVLNYDKVN